MSYCLIDRTAWLNLTNVALGIAVLACGLLIAGSIVHAVIIRARERSHILRNADAEVRELLSGRDSPLGGPSPQD